MAQLGPPKVPTGPSTPGRGAGPNSPSKTANSPSVASRFANSSRPPSVVVLLAVLNTLVTVGLVFLVGIKEVDPLHFVGTALGMFVSVAILGWFRQRIALSRSDGRFLDWRVSSSRVMTSVTTLAWITGVVNLFVICYELSRQFTS